MKRHRILAKQYRKKSGNKVRTEGQTDNDKNNRPNGVMGKGLIEMVTVFKFYNILQ